VTAAEQAAEMAAEQPYGGGPGATWASPLDNETRFNPYASSPNAAMILGASSPVDVPPGMKRAGVQLLELTPVGPLVILMRPDTSAKDKALAAVLLAIALLPGGGEVGEAVEAVTEYEVGTFDNLLARSEVGDDLALHHVGQAHAMEQLIPGYDRATAPAIALTTAEHRLIPNLRGAVGLTPRQLLARDIMNLRTYTNAPNSSLKQLIQLNKDMYPGAFAR
jgi:hypothetical protein